MAVRLRGHHLLCLLTYQGAGYSPAFIANFDAITARLNHNMPVQLIEGADDICAPLTAEQSCAHCHDATVVERDALALRQLRDLRLIDADTSLTLSHQRVAAMRDAFSIGTIRAACKGCEWHDLCTLIADDGYKNVRFTP